MSVLITGSESFLANFVKKKLKNKKIKFYGFDKIKRGSSKKIDILNKNLHKYINKNTSSIIHLAAISSSKDFEKKPDVSFDINVKGTINLIKSAHKKKIKQLIFASTEWVYGEASRKKISEKSKIESSKLGSEYAISKYLCEELIKYYCSIHNIKYVILRFGIIYGPRKTRANWSAVESLISKVYQNEKIIEVGSKRTARTFIHAEDVADAIIKSLKYKKSNILNLSGDRLINLGEIIKISNQKLNKNSKIIEKNKNNFNFRNTNNSLIKKEFKWRPSKTLTSSLIEISNSLKKISKF